LKPSAAFLEQLRGSLAPGALGHLEQAIRRIVEVKQRGERVVVVTGSGPNVHEGITTLIAALIHKGVIDGVITSSAVVAHEMAATLDRVKRVRVEDGARLPIPARRLPRGGVFEITMLEPDRRAQVAREMPEGGDLYERIRGQLGDLVIKAAGNGARSTGSTSRSRGSHGAGPHCKRCPFTVRR
jgi:Deoxyhypusine synthase